MDNLSDGTLFALEQAAVLVCAVVAAKLLQVLLLKFFLRLSNWFHLELNERIEQRARKPLLFLLTFIALSVGLHITALPDPWMTRLQLILRGLGIASVGWLAAAITSGTGDWLVKRYSERFTDADMRDPLATRRFATQVRVLTRVLIAIILVLTLIGIALVIPGLRQLGLSLFASAGVAGIVIGVAANSTLSNLIAGIQVALTQPILLGDQVVVNSQSGIIEEITASYVVVRTGDLRRIIVPLNYFMQNPFENWTYHDPSMFGNVLLYADYTVDVDSLRRELTRVVGKSAKWNQKKCELTVSNCKEHTLELQVTVSARNAAELGDLQNEVREKMVTYLQQQQQRALPRFRLSVKEGLAAES
ncbi:MAG: mechanosensitive ion channel [Alphaproteobacteria bacterium]|nr:mechanosensitive ion channel [Alphaproteobacteria bacterium]